MKYPGGVDRKTLSRRAVSLALLPVIAAASLLLLLPHPDPVAPTLPPPAPLPTPDRLTLDDGQTLEGEILADQGKYVQLRLANGEVRLVRRDRVKNLEQGPQPTGKPVSVTLRSKRVFQGELLRETPTGVELKLQNGRRVTLRKKDVLSIEDRP